VADRDFSRFQKKVIQRYYDNRPALDEQRLAELATELYLAADKKKNQTLGIRQRIDGAAGNTSVAGRARAQNG